MKVSKVEEQALRLSIGLARRGGIATLGELAQQEGLSEALVAKILGRLRRGGVVVAIRGRNGGYTLAASPDELSVTDVLGGLGNPLLQGCFNERAGAGAEPCPHAEDCGLRPVWRHLEGQISRVFGEITLADLMRTEDQVRDRVASLWSSARRKPLRAVPSPRPPAGAVTSESRDERPEAVALPGRADTKEWNRDES